MDTDRGVTRLHALAVLALVSLITAAVVALIVVPDGSGKPADAARAGPGPHPAGSGSPFPRTEPGPATTVTGSPSATSTTATTTSASLRRNPQLARALSWSLRELPRSAHILTGPDPARAFAAAGYPNVVAVSAPGSGMRTHDGGARYLISSHLVRHVAFSDPVVHHTWLWSEPIAMFGSASGRVIIRQVSTLAPDVLAARHDSAVQSGRQAQQKLLADPAVRPSEAVRRALRAGGLDPRSAMALDLAAGSAALDLVRVEVNPAEHAAGLPARRVVVRAASDAALTDALGRLPARYTPTGLDALPDGSVRLTWAIDPVTAGGS